MNTLKSTWFEPGNTMPDQLARADISTDIQGVHVQFCCSQTETFAQKGAKQSTKKKGQAKDLLTEREAGTPTTFSMKLCCRLKMWIDFIHRLDWFDRTV